jgi:hypothetical protein
VQTTRFASEPSHPPLRDILLPKITAVAFS